MARRPAPAGEAKPDREVLIWPNRVRLYPPTDGGSWQIWFYGQDGKRKHTSAVTEADAIERCNKLSAASAVGAHNTLRTFGELLDDYEEHKIHRLEARYAEAQRTTVRACRKNPALLRTQCADLRSRAFQPVFDASSRGHGGKAQLRRSLHTILEHGRAQGFILDTHDPLRGLDIGSRRQGRVAEAGESTRTLRDDEVPDHGMVAELAERLVEMTGVWWTALMVYVAAYGGARFGELVALTAPRFILEGHPDFEAHPQSLRIYWQMTEVSKTVDFGDLGMHRQYLEPPKQFKRRWPMLLPETPGGVDINAMVARRIAELPQLNGQPDPAALMFPDWRKPLEEWTEPKQGERVVGRFWSRHDWDDWWKPAMAAVDGWPDSVTWHGLRDAYCTTLLNDLGMDPSDAIVWSGHKTASVFFERYVGTRPKGLEQRGLAAAASAIVNWRTERSGR